MTTRMTPHIRPYTSSDSTAVLDIWLAASRVGHPFFSEQELQRQKHLVEHHYLPVAEMWVYEQQGVLGFIGMLGTTIGGLFVLPAHFRRGIGAALIRHVAALKGPLAVEVFTANTEAQAFYARCGFTAHDRTVNTDVTPHQELIVMRQPGA